MKIFVENAGALEQPIKEVLSETSCAWDENGITVTLGKCDEGIKIISDGKKITLLYSEAASLFRGLGVIISKGEAAYEITQKMQFKQLGNMIDCSRNAVMKVEQIKKFLRISALMGYNMLQLYTEDTYEIEGEPYFGRLRGRYTQSEMREIDDYAYSLGVEVIPCIQTLAHLNCIFNWPEYWDARDIDDILNVGARHTFELLDKMFATMKACFRSRQINIGMDEAHHLGCGKYLDTFGYKPRAELMKEHLKKVIELCRKYDYEPMMWSDMFFRVSSPNGAYDGSVNLTEEALNSVPENVNLVFWHYYSDKPEYYSSMFEKHGQFNRKYSFAGGSSTWYGFAPAQKYSLNALRAAFEVIGDYKLDTIFNTIWGNDGFETAIFASLTSVAAYAQGAWTGDVGDDAIREAMSIVDADFNDFMNMNAFYKIPHVEADNTFMHKYLLYGDVLQGRWDSNIAIGTNEDFENAVPLFEKAEQNEKWGYIFKPLTALAKVLANKSELGINIKKAYDKDDRAELSRLANEVIPECITDTKELLKFHRKRWRTENKDFGFETQDLRLGGLVARLENACEMINEYLDGKCEKLDELEEERLSIDKRIPVGTPINNTGWHFIVTSGRVGS